jgi:hypothetical protein
METRQDFARPVSAHRRTTLLCHRCRCGARGAAKRHHRAWLTGTSDLKLIRRPLSKGGWLPAEGRERHRGPILRRSRRGTLACAIGRSAAWPHRLRRMAPPLTGSSLIAHLPTGDRTLEKVRDAMRVARLFEPTSSLTPTVGIGWAARSQLLRILGADSADTAGLSALPGSELFRVSTRSS